MTAMRLKRYPSPSGGFALGKAGVGATMLKQGKTARDYVQDGLIAMWDGIENAGWGVHDSNLSPGDVLANLCGMDILKLSANTQIGDNYFSGSLATESYSQIKGVVENGDVTVEIVAKRTDTSTSRLNFFQWNSSSSNYVFLFQERSTSDGKVVVWCYDGVMGVRPSLSSLSRFSLSISRNSTARVLAFNGNVETTDYLGTSVPDITYAPAIGVSGIQIHSIRIYSRALTASEIARNYAIDKERFNLP